ncbi:MAG: GatB/YqeY domain-containing protein [Saprospiraceae bacterium]|nr:GatB/YqeY domain-containing protein [Saprospiraceae bacterium]
MSLESKIMGDLKAAMKAKDQASIRSIRAIKAAILLAKTDGSGKEIDEAGEIKMVQKLVKQRQDSLEIYEKQGREDLAVTEREEIEVLKKYLPEQMSESDLKAFIEALIGEVGASSMKDMGKVMGLANQRLAGKADGKTISVIVRQLLTS